MNLKERLKSKGRPAVNDKGSINMYSSVDPAGPGESSSGTVVYLDPRSSKESPTELEYNIVKSTFESLSEDQKQRFHTEVFKEVVISNSEFMKGFINAFGFVLDDSLEKAGYGRKFDRLTDAKKERFFRAAASMSPYGDILRIAKEIDRDLFPSYNKSRNFKLRTILSRAQVFAAHYKYLYGL